MPHQSFNNPKKTLGRTFADESGSAVLEFVGFGLLLQVPLLMMAVNFAEVQAAQFAAEAIARHSLRSYVLTGASVTETADEIISDFRLSTKPTLQLSCHPIGDCNNPGDIVTLRVQLANAKAQSVMRHP